MGKTPEQKAALEEIARIRRNGFDPGEKLVRLLIKNHGALRALDLMRLAADYDRTVEPVQ